MKELGRDGCYPSSLPQVSGKRAAVEKDQEKISTSELLLEDYLKKLGSVQTHLQARPKACLVAPESSSATTAAGGGTFTLVCFVVVVEVALPLCSFVVSTLFDVSGELERPEVNIELSFLYTVR